MRIGDDMALNRQVRSIANAPQHYTRRPGRMPAKVAAAIGLSRRELSAYGYLLSRRGLRTQSAGSRPKRNRPNQSSLSRFRPTLEGRLRQLESEAARLRQKLKNLSAED